MNLRIENFRRRSRDLARNQGQTSLGVNRRLMFGENNQGRPGFIEPRVHSGSDFHSTRQREANVDAIAHFIGSECLLDFVDDFFARRKFDKRKRAGRTLEAIEMLVQFENAAVVKPQAFPDRVPSLHRGIERTDAGLVAMHQLAVDVYDQVAVFRIKFLQHLKSAHTKSTKDTKNF